MNVVSWASLVEAITSSMFVCDTDGRSVFFPWGFRSRGYFLKSARRKSTIAQFYAGSVVVYFVGLAIVVSRLNDFWPIVEALAACSALWLFTWFVYARNVTRSLPAAHESYPEIVLKKLSQDTTEYVPTKVGSNQTRQPPVSPPAADFLLPLRALYYRLSPGQLAAASWVVLGIVWLIWDQLHPSIFEGQSGNSLGAAVLCFFGGLGTFFIGSRMNTTGLWQFINWKLSYLLMTVALWVMTIYLLFRYFVQ